MKAPLLTLAAMAALARADVPGFDISHYQKSVDFAAAYKSGARFVIIKATEGSNYIDPVFSSHYAGAAKAGFIRGGYHFAHPGETSGAAQADYFLAHGGAWSGNGMTLPGMLDLEAGGKGNCWGISAPAMVSWIKAFGDRYREKTGRNCLIYTNPSWWRECTGDSNAFAKTNPLVLARYASAPGEIPGGWPYQTIWQFNDAYKYGGDSDTFRGDMAALTRLATG